MPSIARAALGDAAAAGAWVCLATPVHLVAGMTSVTLPEDGVLPLSLAEAAALSSSFKRDFHGAGVTMEAREAAQGREAILLCVFDRVLDVATYAPESAAGRDVFEYQPAGADASRLRRFMSEIEMWLFEHEVNRARVARSSLPITGLWLWGGGSVDAALPRVNGWVSGCDTFFSAFGDLPSFPCEGRAGVVVSSHTPGGAHWSEVESRWLTPAMAALRAGHIDRLELSAADRRLTVRKGFAWRFWRRPRPWWESFGRAA